MTGISKGEQAVNNIISGKINCNSTPTGTFKVLSTRLNQMVYGSKSVTLTTDTKVVNVLFLLLMRLCYSDDLTVSEKRDLESVIQERIQSHPSEIYTDQVDVSFDPNHTEYLSDIVNSVMSISRYIDTIDHHYKNVKVLSKSVQCSDSATPTVRTRERIIQSRNIRLIVPKIIETQKKYTEKQKKKFITVVILFLLLFYAWYSLIGTVLLSGW